jgi:hypothetical protein
LATFWNAAHGSAGAEGVYLNGQGVIYTVTLQGPVIDSGAATAKAAPKIPDEWEQQRQQLRGSKAEVKEPTETAKEPPLREVLLKLLARYGHKFSHLGSRETVTVVLTFREPSTVSESGLTPAGALNPDLGTKPSTPTAQSSTSRDYELLADLHLKQNRAQEAIEAYKNAIAKHGGAKDDAKARELYLKMGHAELAAAMQAQGGNRDERILNAIKFLRRVTEQTAKAAPAGPATHLPARLIVSAPKSLLDQVAAGKITFEEFRSRANVEFVPSVTLQKGPAAKAP